LFRPQDAEALLTCGYVLRSSGKIAPAWWIGASLVQPARASEILRQAVDDETRQSEAKNSYVQGTGMMAGYLWRIRGPAEKDFLVEWFYSSLFVKSSPLPQQEEFFRVVNLAARPETKQLLAALVRDRRFELTDWEVLREMLETVNAARKTPLVAKTEIYDAQPGSRPDQKLVLDRWRNLLRREFGFAAVPSPNESPPKKVLTAPAYSILLTNAARRIILSRNGRWLATVNEGDNRGEVQVRDADSGQLVWNFPASRLSLIAFEDSGHLLQLENGLHEWDVEKRAEVRTAKLTGGPVSGAWGESPAFDSAGVRLGFAGYQDIVCFDTASGRALWICHADSGVGAASALSRDGSLLAVGGGSDTARVVGAFDAANGKLLRRFDNHSGKVWALTFSPDNHSLITVTSENGARRWDVATGELQGEYSYPVEFIGAGLPIWQPVFSPDGRRLAIAGAFTKANTFRIGIFDVATGEMEWEVRRTAKAGNDGPPFGLAFSPDGQTLYSCGRRIEAWPLK
jgi:hypothetical protein